MTQLTPDDVQVAKDAVITLLTNALLRAEAECAAHRRDKREERDGSDDPAPQV